MAWGLLNIVVVGPSHKNPDTLLPELWQPNPQIMRIGHHRQAGEAAFGGFGLQGCLHLQGVLTCRLFSDHRLVEDGSVG